MLHPSHFLPLRSHPRRPTVSFSQKRIIPSKRHRRFSILILTRFNPSALRLRAQSGSNLKKRKSSSAIILEKLCQLSRRVWKIWEKERRREKSILEIRIPPANPPTRLLHTRVHTHTIGIEASIRGEPGSETKRRGGRSPVGNRSFRGSEERKK